jgi:hypothetical protein
MRKSSKPRRMGKGAGICSKLYEAAKTILS